MLYMGSLSPQVSSRQVPGLSFSGHFVSESRFGRNFSRYIKHTQIKSFLEEFGICLLWTNQSSSCGQPQECGERSTPQLCASRCSSVTQIRCFYVDQGTLNSWRVFPAHFWTGDGAELVPDVGAAFRRVARHVHRLLVFDTLLHGVRWVCGWVGEGTHFVREPSMDWDMLRSVCDVFERGVDDE